MNLTWRQWPCPGWYHVPSAWEWNKLLEYWATAYWIELDYRDGLLHLTGNSKFHDDFKIPSFWGLISKNSAVFESPLGGVGTYLITSSPSGELFHELAVANTESYIALSAGVSSRAHGMLLRCFRDASFNGVPEYIDTEWNVFEMGTLTVEKNGVTYTLMDRNLWATTNDISDTGSYWYYFQRWNNHWFNSNNLKFWNRIDGSNYTWNNPFVSDRFVLWDGWSLVINPNIRWWSWDTSGSNLNPHYMRQWPCPEKYHVLSALEWKTIFAGNSNTVSTNLHLPKAGYMNPNYWNMLSVGATMDYWSSSKSGGVANPFRIDLFPWYSNVLVSVSSKASYGYNIRCVHDYDGIPTSVLYFNTMGSQRMQGQTVPTWGTGHTPWYFPKKTGYDFAWWYKDENYNQPFDFQTDIITSDTTIYAKWTEYVSPTVSISSNGSGLCTLPGNVYTVTWIFNKQIGVLSTWSLSVTNGNIQNFSIVSGNVAVWTIKAGFVYEIETGWKKTLTVCDPNDNTSCITMMDRNLWATKAWTVCSELNSWACGYHYQWWSNYGFEIWCRANRCRQDETYYNSTEERAVWNDSYDKHWYDWPVTGFMRWVTNITSQGFGLLFWNYWSGDEVHRDVRWWSGDDDTNNWWLDLNNSLDRRWPCDTWYHVPSAWEWNRLLEYWAANYTWDWNSLTFTTQSFTEILKKFSGNPAAANQFKLNFKVPFAGHRSNDYGHLMYENDARFWLSSAAPSGTYDEMGIVSKITSSAVSDSVYQNDNGLSVRCFKDEPLNVLDLASTISVVVETGAFLDALGNINTGSSNTISRGYDGAGPNWTIDVKYNWNDDYASGTTLKLTLTAQDPWCSNTIKMQFSCNVTGRSSPENFSGTKNFALSSYSSVGCSTSQWVKTIYVRYVDWLGNTWEVYSDSILLDTVSPTIAFTWATPANNAKQNKTYFTGQVNFTELNLKEFKWMLDGNETVPYDDSLVLMYNFDNVQSLWEWATLVKDLSKYGRDGVVYWATWTNDGVYGWAFRFNGTTNNYIDFPSYGDLTSNWTISLWVKWDHTRTNFQIVFWNYNGLAVWFRSTWADILWSASNYKPTWVITWYDATKWNHIVVSLNNWTISYYVNGIKLTNWSNDSWAWTNNWTWRVWMRNNSTNLPYPFSWYVDEIRVYNRALTSWEIQTLYRSNLAKTDVDKWTYTILQTWLTNGTHRYTWYVKDVVWYTVSTGRTLIVDLLAPTVSISSNGSWMCVWPDTVYTITWTFSEAVTGVYTWIISTINWNIESLNVVSDTVAVWTVKKGFVYGIETWWVKTLTICDSNWTWCITMMDRNIWATASNIYTYDTGVLWYYYQRWNNHGLVNYHETPHYLQHDATSSRAIWNSSYSHHWYDWPITGFISRYPDYWSGDEHHDDLRWWEGDNSGNNYWYPVTNPTDRQWPCPNWYHVPSIWEWDKVLEYWMEETNIRYTEQWDAEGYPGLWYMDWNWKEINENFNLSLAGYREGNGSIMSNILYYNYNIDAAFWSSSPNVGGSNNARSFLADQRGLIIETMRTRGDALSVRCFRNTPLDIPALTWIISFTI